MSEIILMSDARVAAIPVMECAEQLVEVRGFLLVDDRKHADWPGERIRAAASRYVSPPEIAPHTAGAAVDLAQPPPPRSTRPSRARWSRASALMPSASV